MSQSSMNERFWFVSVSLMLAKTSKKRAKKMQEPEYYLIKTLYELTGGSWVGLAEGDAECWNHLRTCCKTYLKVCKDMKVGPYAEKDAP